MTLEEEPIKNLTRAQQVHMGMSKDEVKGIMGEAVVIGYEITDVKQGTTKPVTVKNPQRTETIQQGTKVYDVSYYFTHIVKADGAITDDELTPFIFENNQLLAKGWYFLNKIRKP